MTLILPRLHLDLHLALHLDLHLAGLENLAGRTLAACGVGELPGVLNNSCLLHALTSSIETRALRN